MCAVKILSCLGKQLNFSNQAALLRWIILVYDILDSRTKLQQLYGVAFHYLSYETLRTPLCHILYYLTRREDVKPFRIRKLMDLRITVGVEPALIGLLHVYKSYSPDLLLGPMTISQPTIFKCPDQALSTLIMGIQERWSHLNEIQGQQLSFNGSKEPLVRSGTKRQKISHSSIPDALSIYQKGRDSKALPVSQITSLDSLVAHIDTLALPDQVSSVLSNRVLQHVLCLQASNSIVERISYWLGQELMDLWYWREKTDVVRARFSTLLEKVVEVTTTIKDLLPVMEYFLIPYLRVWNGVDHQKEIFTLITYLRPRGYEELFVHFLKPLHGLFYLMGPLWKGELILCYTRLLRHWAQFKWGDYLEVGEKQRLSEQGQEGLRRLFTKLASDVDYMQTIRVFIDHVDSISSVALEMENDHIAVQHGILSFFELVPSLTLMYKVPMAVVIPDSTIVYRCFLSDSGMSVSRICGIVYHYKMAFHIFEDEQQLQFRQLVQSQLDGIGDDQAAKIRIPEVPGYNRDYVILFNSFVMDICNFLWRTRAFNKTDKNARGFLVDDSIGNILDQDIEIRENVSLEKRVKAPASVAGLKEAAAKGGLDMTFEEYRVKYLDYLKQNGFDGISIFLNDSIINLHQRKQRIQEQQHDRYERRLSQSMQKIRIEDNNENAKETQEEGRGSSEEEVEVA
ncbi:hypothetical protein BGX34_011280 [Mortierella sp. NVP85]|nr:hypothetical protein BGX34_011280 [Mortierella sp. NVP85]